MADSINILVPKEAIDSIIQTDAAITKLDIVYRKMLTTIEQGTKVMKDSAVTEENLTKAKKTQTETTEQLDAASKKLAASEKALVDFDKEKYAQTARNSQALKEQQSEILKMVQAEKLEKNSIDALNAANAALRKEVRGITTDTEAGRKKIMEINTVIEKNTATIRQNSDAAIQQKMNIGNYASALSGLPGPLGAAGAAGTKFVGVLDIIKKHPIIFAISLIVGAFIGLVKIFKGTEEGGDKLAIMMGKVKGVLDVVKVAAQSITLALADLFSGKFGQAAEHIKEGFGGIVGRAKETSKAVGELVDTLDKIGEEKMAYNIEEIKNKIIKLRDAAAKTPDKGERVKFYEEAIALNKELYTKEMDWADRAAKASIEAERSKFGISKELFMDYINADQAGRLEMVKNNQQLANYAAITEAEKIATLKKGVKESISIETDGIQETLKMRKAITQGEESDRKEAATSYKQRVEDAKRAEKERLDAIKDATEKAKALREDAALFESSFIEQQREQDLTGLNQMYLAGKISAEKYESEKARIAEYYDNEILKSYLDTLEKEIKAGGLSVGKEAEMLAKAAKLKTQITDNQFKERTDSEKAWDEEYKAMLDDEWNAFEYNKKREKEAEKDAADYKKEIIQKTADLISEAGNAIFEINNANIEADITGIEKKRDKELQAADESIKDEKKKKAAQSEINAKYDKQLAEEKTKQAKNDKMAALFQIGINTAVASMATLAKVPLPAGAVLLALTIALGAVQAAAVLAKPIPTFAKGTKGQYNTPSAFVAGEAGTEIIEKQTGEMMAVTRPTVFTNAKGMRIYSNPEIQNLNRMMVNNQVNFDTSELKEIHKGIDNMARSLAGQKQYIMQNGKAVGYSQDGYTRKYLERMIG